VDAQGWDERYAGTELVWSAAPNQFVAQALGDLSPGRAVDLAAGEGRNALWLAGRGWEVTAVDFAQVGLDKGASVEARLGTGPPIAWVCADVLTWDGLDSDQTWDLAVVAYLQLPGDQRRAAVRRAFGALREGGELFWVAHDSSNLVEGTGGPQDPDVLTTAEELLADLGDQRFEVIRAERVERTVEPEHGGDPTLTAYDCLVHLRRR
jgi:SAM-dependent methyltransferase